MPNFLEVDDSIISNNLLLNGQPQNQDHLLQSFASSSGGGYSKAPLLTPEQKKLQEQCKFIVPRQGLCVKSKELDKNGKFFLNLCHANEVPEPELNFTDEELATILDEGTDNEIDDVRIPMSIGEIRKEVDKNGVECLVVDIIINTRFFDTKVTKSDLYKTFLLVIAFEGVEEKYKLRLEKSKYTVLHNRKSFGKLQPQFVMNKPAIKELKEPVGVLGTTPSSILGKSGQLGHSNPIIESTTEIKRPRLVQELSTSDLKLDFVITQLSEDLATVHVQLPNLRNPNKLYVKLGADRIIVESPTGCIDVFVPLDIHQEESTAEYDPEKKVLTLRLPLI